MRSASTISLLLLLAAVPARAYNPGEPGFLPIGQTTLTFVDASRGGRTLVSEVWYPALGSGRDATPRRTHSPLVLLLHGHCGSRLNYTYLARHLVSRGCTVVAPDLPDFCADTGSLDVSNPPLDLIYLRTALRDPTGPAGTFKKGEFRSSLRGKPAAVVAHSLGAPMAVNAMVGDTQLRPLVVVAPLASAALAESMAGLKRPPAVLALAGLADTTTPLDTYARPFFDALRPPSFLVTIAGGSHSGFTDTDAALPPEVHARQQELTKRFAAAVIERYLARDTRAARALTLHDATLQGADVTLERHGLQPSR